MSPSKSNITLELVTSGQLTVAGFPGFYPIAYEDEEQACGYDYEYLKNFAESLGLKLQVKFFDFDGIWARPGRGEVDIAAAGIANCAGREAENIEWSEPYFEVQRCLVIRASDAQKFKSIKDFAGHRIESVPRSTAHLDLMTRVLPGTEVLAASTLENSLEKLLSHKIDAFGTGDAAGHAFVARYPDLLALTDVHRMPYPEPFVFAVRANNGLLAPLNKFIATHAYPPSYFANRSKWRFSQVAPKDQQGYII